LDALTLFQHSKIKGPIVDMDNRFNKSLLKVITIQSNSGSVLVVTDGLSIRLSIRKPRKYVLYPIILASHLRTLTRRANAIISS